MQFAGWSLLGVGGRGYVGFACVFVWDLLGCLAMFDLLDGV